MPESLKGRLLVATPALTDPNFDHTVVLVLEHDEDGAVGVVLNRPSGTDVGEPLPEWRELAADPSVVFIGGPVSPSVAICLARTLPGREAEGYQPLFGLLGTVDLSQEPEELVPALEGIRVFVGYAGWGEGQLEGEIEEGGWFVVDAVDDDVLSTDPTGLWAAVLRRQRGHVAMYANFPSDPSWN